MVADVTLRRYRPVDAERVRELHEVALRDAGGFIEGAPAPDLEDVEAHYLDDGEFLVGTADGDLVAMGAFRPVSGFPAEFLDDLDDAAEVKRLRVDPQVQQSGYGQQLYDELERRARSAGIGEFVLDTTPVQDAAIAFFEANDFERAGREDLTFEDQAFTLLFYRKSL